MAKRGGSQGAAIIQIMSENMSRCHSRKIIHSGVVAFKGGGTYGVMVVDVVVVMFTISI